MISRQSRSTRALIFVILFSMRYLVSPGLVIAEDSESNKNNSHGMSQTETVLAATCFGSGFALVFTSAFSEGQKTIGGEKVGTDTGGLLIAGGTLIFLGLCFVIAPVVGDRGEAESNSAQIDKHPSVQLQTVSLNGGGTAIGISYEF